MRRNKILIGSIVLYIILIVSVFILRVIPLAILEILWDKIIVSYFILNFLYYVIVISFFRYIVMFINLFRTIDDLTSKEYEYPKLKLIFCSNLLSLGLFIFFIYFRIASLYVTINVLTIYPEVIATTFFNIPLLCLIANKVIKNKFFVILLWIVLVLIFAFNIYLLKDGEFLESFIILP